MEGTFVLIALIVCSCHVGISSGSSSEDVLPNLMNVTDGQDDNQQERRDMSIDLEDVLPNMMNETDGQDDNEQERRDMSINPEDFLQSMTNVTEVEDDIQQQRSNISTRGGCKIENGVYIGAGNNVKHMSTSGQAECSSLCFRTSGCVAWTLKTDGNYCWLKSNSRSKGSLAGWITGTKECGRNAAHSYSGYLYLDGGYWGGWGGAQYCPYPHFASKMELKIESPGGDDTALNGIRLTCSDGRTITSAQSGWGNWRGVRSCSSENFIRSAVIRREGDQGWGDDTAANGVRFICTDGRQHTPGDGYWGSWHSWKNCPSGSAVYGIQTQIEGGQGGGDDTALNDVKLFCARLPACSGHPNQMSCCTASRPCPYGKGDCDTDSECAGALVCGYNNCRTWHSSASADADCCIHKIIHGGWSAWGRCSKTCRYGYQSRSCTNPRPQNGGRGCSGSSSQRCNENVCCPVNGGWSGWGRCSHSCKDYGKQTRTCTNPRPACGGRGCSGLSSQKCNQHICCPVNGGWSDWSRCNKSCKDGALETRTCTNPRPSCNGRGCSGSSSQKCNQHVFCPVDGGWSSWSKCSKTCKDGAVQTRTCTNPARKYGGKTCSGSTSQKCNQNIPCSSEIRKCISTEGCPLVKNKMLTTFPELSKEFYMSFEFRATQYIGGWQSVIHLTTGANAGHGGRVPALWVYNSGQLHPCFSVNGNTNYQIVTSTKYSVGQWHHIEFSQALENSKYIYRVKIDGAKAIEVVNSRPSVYSTVKIYAADPWHNSLKGFLRNLIINTHKFGDCGGKDSGCCTSSSPCGKDDGDCDSNNDCLPGLVCGTNNCPNKGVTNSDANTWDRTDDCCTYPAVPGGWSSWGKCSKTCKTGAVQTRTCTNPKPQHGGKDCLGSASQKCNQNIHCPIPGGWSSWSKCSKTCKDGALQTRTCTEPKPQHGGKDCSGPASQKCNQNMPCPVDGGWSSWSNCGKTCKDGAVQSRTCTEPKPQHGGKNCPGSTSQKCNQNIHCPIDGGWNIWSKCSETCNKDGAVQIRKCDNPKPEHGGTHCPGLVSQKCNQNINCGTTSAPATCPPIPTCPPIATCPDKTCPPIPSCPTVPPTPTCPPKTTCPTKTCPPTPTCPTAPQQTPCPAKTCPSIPTCPTETCPPIPTCPTEKCPPSPICPTDGAVTTTTSKTSDTCDDTGCKNAFNGLGMCVDTASADWVKLSKTIDFTAGTKDGKCSKSCNCNCYKHTGCYSDQCDAKQGICLIPEQVENRGFFIPNEYKKAFPCNKSLNCYCYIKDYVGVTKSAEVVTEPRSKPSCKPTKKCTKKKGKCFGKGETIPEKAKRRGWCNKKMGCKCYKV